MVAYKTKIVFSDDRESECIVDLDNSSLTINHTPGTMSVREHQFIDHVLYSLVTECQAVNAKRVEVELE